MCVLSVRGDLFNSTGVATSTVDIRGELVEHGVGIFHFVSFRLHRLQFSNYVLVLINNNFISRKIHSEIYINQELDRLP